MAQNVNIIQIQYKQNQKFETDNGYVLPSYILVSVANNVYTLLVPKYCLDANGKMQNSIMWSLYPQFAAYDFASGQV